MTAEFGNFILVVPLLVFSAAGTVFILIALRDRSSGPAGRIPNLTARRKHPLRHLQVEVNRARKAAREAARAEQGDDKGEEQPRPRRRRDSGPGGPRPV
jgi:hypothetical protein